MNVKVQNAVEAIQKASNTPLEQFKDMLCNYLCLITDSTLSYFAKWDQAHQILTMIGWSKSAMINCSMIDKPIVYKLIETGLWGDAIREKKPVITNDYKNLVKPTKKGYPKGHINVKKHMNLPIRENGKPVLIVGVGNKIADYNLDDAKKIEELMNQVWPILKSKL